jgi:hypothetical protein
MYSAAARGARLRLRQAEHSLKRQRIGVRLARPLALVKQICFTGLAIIAVV